LRARFTPAAEAHGARSSNDQALVAGGDCRHIAVMPESRPAPDLAGLTLSDIAALNAHNRLPPVEKWNPAYCGDSDMRIASDGTWYHQGSPIGRPAMVRLFSTILRREADGSFVLVTPVEKLSIAVDDAPFVAVELKSEGQGRSRRLAFRLNTGDVVLADAEHPISITEHDDGPHPYVKVRSGLDALIARSVYYELANLALDEEGDPPGLWSEGRFFALEPQ
jgi:hypothetical protein